MDATREVPNLDPRGDAMACAALLLAMVIGAMFAVLAVHLPAELF
jgi:hypothetical protein